MRQGFIVGALCASAAVGLFASRASAQVASYARIQRGAAVASEVYEPVAYQESAEPGVEEVPGPGAAESLWTTDEGTPCGCGCEAGGCDMLGCCEEDCCGSMMDGCGGCCPPRFGLAAGVEATFLQLSNVEDTGISFFDEFDFEAAPRLWVQWQGASGWGVRGRYWNFDADKSANTVIDEPDIVGSALVSERIELYAADLELTRYFSVRQVDCWLSLGARHARLHDDADLQVALFDLAGGGGDDASVISQSIDREFQGTGPTFGIDMRRQILGTRFAAICNLRGSVLWGDNDLDLDANVIEVVPVGAGDLDLNDFTNQIIAGRGNEEMWVGELQAGGEWMVPISAAYGGGNAFVRVMFEAQWWNLPGLTIPEQEIVQEDNLHEFLGGTIAAGIVR